MLDEREIIAARYNSRGVSKVNAGDRQEAINDFTRAIRFYPDFAPAYYNRAVFQANLGLDREAISDYYRAIEYNPCFALAYLGRGLMRYSTLHQKEEALAGF
ncbi:MAG: tetratricopeptide repeat protein [Candidatus Omnitrophica bacterium]|nr:tetratricopeptide repeat protein [Candidatus Omnitrophota bacterium]